MTTEMQTYTTELLFALRTRDVPGPRIAEALAEVHSHVTETGEDPRDAFGPPRAYAEEVSAALGHPGASSGAWLGPVTRTAAACGLGGSVGTWLLLDGALAFGAGESGPLGSPPVVPLLLGLAVLVATAVGLGRLARHSDDLVLDPRTGQDMTPPLPRWVRPVMVSPAVFGMVLAAAAAVAVAVNQR